MQAELMPGMSVIASGARQSLTWTRSGFRANIFMARVFRGEYDNAVFRDGFSRASILRLGFRTRIFEAGFSGSVFRRVIFSGPHFRAGFFARGPNPLRFSREAGNAL
jgi:hypothetical protein